MTALTKCHMVRAKLEDRIRELEAELDLRTETAHRYAEECQRLRDELAGLKKGEPVAWLLTETYEENGLWESRETVNFDGNGKPLYLSPVIPEGYQLVPVEPITGKNYEQGLWSRRNWDAAIEDMLSACKGE